MAPLAEDISSAIFIFVCSSWSQVVQPAWTPLLHFTAVQPKFAPFHCQAASVASTLLRFALQCCALTSVALVCLAPSRQASRLQCNSTNVTFTAPHNAPHPPIGATAEAEAAAEQEAEAEVAAEADTEVEAEARAEEKEGPEQEGPYSCSILDILHLPCSTLPLTS